jgi:hypothetical protein
LYKWMRAPFVWVWLSRSAGQYQFTEPLAGCACLACVPAGLAGALSPHWVGGGRVGLGVGFPLRCFQRLSRPDVAIQRCPWRDNWWTRGSSVPVLSY